MKKTSSIVLIIVLVLVATGQGLVIPVQAQSGITVDPILRTVENDYIRISWDLTVAERVSGLYLKDYDPTYNLVGNHPNEFTGNATYISTHGGVGLVGSGNTDFTWDYILNDRNVTVSISSLSPTGIQVVTKYMISADSPAIWVKRMFGFGDNPITGVIRLNPYHLRAYDRAHFTTFVYPRTNGTIAFNTNVCEVGCPGYDWGQSWIDIEAPVWDIGLGLANFPDNPESYAWMDRDAYSATSYVYGTIPGTAFSEDVTVSYAIVPHLGNYATVNWDSLTYPPSILPDLYINSVSPIQVVENPDINNDGRLDYVLGKPMVVKVDVGVENSGSLPQSTHFSVELNYLGEHFVETRQISDLVDGAVALYFPKITPDLVGEFPVSASVHFDDSFPESNPDNNDTTIGIEIKDTKGLHLAYMAMDYGGAVTEFDQTVLNSGLFIAGVYPVAPSEFINEPLLSLAKPSNFFGISDIDTDMISLYQQGKKLSPQADRIIGVVNDKYWIDHLGCVVGGLTLGIPGVEFATLKVALVTDGRWDSAAHEIGHTFGLGENYVLSGPICSSTITYPGDQARGYWVEPPDGESSFRSGINIMGVSQSHSYSNWITLNTYTTLFKKFNIHKNDPEILIMGGIIHEDGRVELAPIYKADFGLAEEIVPGDYSLKMFDMSGKLIQETSFGLAKTMIVNPQPPIELDSGVFVFSIPYLDEAQSFQITFDDTTIEEVDITSTLLRDAINSIPDYGFYNNPSQLRNALNNKVDALEEQIRSGDITGAINKLDNDIKVHLSSWILDGYQPENALQYSKSEILSLVDDLVSRLMNN